jgi:GTP-binding protein Era
VGKSSLLNRLVGEKIAIVSPHPQTTRRRIAGVLTRVDAQVVFLDMPGLHEPRHVLGRQMLEAAKSAIEEADVLVAVIDAAAGLRAEDERCFERLRALRRPRLLAVNKVDLVRKPRLLPLLKACADTGLFDECVPVSAKTGEQLDVLLRLIIARLPEGPRWYEETQRTDQTIPQRITELIREQALLATRQEVPHAVAVRLEEFAGEDRLARVRATILVERPGQKAILIGRQGAMLKRIGQAARLELERLLGRKVFLDLWVKVAERWRSDARALRELGYGG